MRLAVVLALAIGCSKGVGQPAAGSGSGGGSSAPRRGSAGGFSASLSAELKGSDGKPVAAGSDAKPAPVGSGSDAKPAAGSNVKPVGSGSDAKPATGSAAPASPVDTGTVAQVSAAELALIKFELLPNWERDTLGPGSVELKVRPPGGGQERSFVFGYGYDDPRAPTDRDQYKKWLASSKLLEPKLDRQRGAAWYIEGTDPTGIAVFRYIVTWGGKRLICYGSMYREPEFNALGDIRDEVVNQVKKICESMSL